MHDERLRAGGQGVLEFLNVAEALIHRSQRRLRAR